MLLRKSDVLKTYDLGGAPSRQTSSNFQKSYCNLKIRSPGVILCVAFLLFLFWKQLLLFKVKESMLFVEQKYKLDGIQISNIVFERWTWCFKLKLKLWWIGAPKRKKSAFFVTFVLSERNVSFISIYIILNKLIYVLLYLKKRHIRSDF